LASYRKGAFFEAKVGAKRSIDVSGFEHVGFWKKSQNLSEAILQDRIKILLGWGLLMKKYNSSSQFIG